MISSSEYLVLVVKKCGKVFSRARHVFKASWDLNKAPLKCENDRINFVMAKFLFFFIILLGVVVIAYMACDVINDFIELSRTQVLCIQIFSVALTSTGVLGKREWGFRSIKACSKTVIFEEQISDFLTIIGFLIFCITMVIEVF